MDESVAHKSVPRSRDDDRASAFRQLAEHHLGDSYRLASAILGDATESKDAVHDAFLTAWSKWDHLRDPAKFESWFGRIVVNTCRNRLKRRSRRTHAETEQVAVVRTDDPYGPLHDRLRLESALPSLKPDDQIILALRYYRDLKVEDVAEILGVPPGTVMSRLHRAQRRLRGLLEAAEGKRE